MKFPEHFKEKLCTVIPENESDDFLQALSDPPTTSIRRNPHKCIPILFQEENAIPWESEGCYVANDTKFILDPEWHAGAYYVQEPSSMILGEFFRSLPESGDTLMVLDLCAAPGGKSTHLRSLMSKDSFLVSNEIDPQRFSILRENITRWGHNQVLLTRTEPKTLGKISGFFDLILVDAPCSGEGMFRKDPQAIQHWGLNNIQQCHQRQTTILHDILPSLKPGGVLIYSTCTYNQDENERIGDWLCAEYNLESIAPELPSDWGFTKRTGSHTTAWVAYPHKVRGEGIAMQMFRKPGGKTPDTKNGKQALAYQKLSTMPSIIKEWYPSISERVYINKEGYLVILPHDMEICKILMQFLGNTTMVWPEAGVIKGKDFIPSGSLALNVAIKEKHPTMELTLQNAWQYFKGSTEFDLNQSPHEPGWHIVSYRQQSLGWIKIVDQRIKNHYPKNWRIRQALPPV
jgi:16S rRNA C967 or C1407 C5-methylase (RsmB/RsmF family)